MRSSLHLVLVLAALTGCATSPRFQDRPVVWRVDDRRDIEQPGEAEFYRLGYGLDAAVARQLPRTLELRDREPAHNTNALDEVPDSTWFTNRIGVRDISPEEAALGPMVDGPAQLPLRVVGGKGGGANPGFIVEDSTGRRFIVKFDTHDYPGMQTATSPIVNRIFWTLGYNVPQDAIVVFARADLVIGEGACFSDGLGRKVPVTNEWLDEVLATSPQLDDGSYRASTSQFVEGIPVGGFAAEGVRRDDPNDVIRHEHRRELRALRVFSAWLGHTDIKEDNTLDVYVEEDGRRFLKHYLLDFGEALGGLQADVGRMEVGWEHAVDWQHGGLGLVTFGLWRREWEGQEETPWPAIGAFAGEPFEPDRWREYQPYWPFREADAADLYWGAKLVLRFDRPTLEAIVAEGQLGDPAAATYLVDALLQRREKIGQTWLEAVTPLDYFRIHGDTLCAVDVGVESGIALQGVVERVDSGETFTVAADGAVCLPLDGDEGYTVERLRVWRGTEPKRVLQVHYIQGDSPRVLGVIRAEP